LATECLIPAFISLLGTFSKHKFLRLLIIFTSVRPEMVKYLPFYGQKKKTSEMFQNIDIYMTTSGNELHYLWFI